ncbi:hypothetical protein M758_UG188800 [Ceratodon purpureus]|nr:hypothetical protein M758_UG188800 [Ceratodon purpureus]
MHACGSSSRASPILYACNSPLFLCPCDLSWSSLAFWMSCSRLVEEFRWPGEGHGGLE